MPTVTLRRLYCAVFWMMALMIGYNLYRVAKGAVRFANEPTTYHACVLGDALLILAMSSAAAEFSRRIVVHEDRRAKALQTNR